MRLNEMPRSLTGFETPLKPSERSFRARDKTINKQKREIHQLKQRNEELERKNESYCKQVVALESKNEELRRVIEEKNTRFQEVLKAFTTLEKLNVFESELQKRAILTYKRKSEDLDLQNQNLFNRSVLAEAEVTKLSAANEELSILNDSLQGEKLDMSVSCTAEKRGNERAIAKLSKTIDKFFEPEEGIETVMEESANIFKEVADVEEELLFRTKSHFERRISELQLRKRAVARAAFLEQKRRLEHEAEQLRNTRLKYLMVVLAILLFFLSLISNIA
ncbi:hypothetical protein QR680_019226 [Steinernema hermaphroditum]|uniref:Uncharacterized protein n=1 Tax=Steinernema hermaphroditum TaxID=289476 RepID=A0AA39HMK9_9BILA|nr:hypothetical protein QR680_019226 [Steinernema hermaphroditum]